MIYLLNNEKTTLRAKRCTESTKLIMIFIFPRETIFHCNSVFLVIYYIFPYYQRIIIYRLNTARTALYSRRRTESTKLIMIPMFPKKSIFHCNSIFPIVFFRIEISCNIPSRASPRVVIRSVGQRTLREHFSFISGLHRPA